MGGISTARVSKTGRGKLTLYLTKGNVRELEELEQASVSKVIDDWIGRILAIKTKEGVDAFLVELTEEEQEILGEVAFLKAVSVEEILQNLISIAIEDLHAQLTHATQFKKDTD